MIAGVIDGTTDTFDTIQDPLTQEEGWADVGMDDKICGGKAGQATCHAQEAAKASRIDYIFSKPWLTPALDNCRTDRCDDYPTHKPLMVDIRIKELKQSVREHQPTTDVAKPIEDMIQNKIEEARDRQQEDNQDQQEETEVHIDEAKTTRAIVDELHTAMDQQIDNRQHRLEHVALSKDTNRLWTLIIAAVKEANIHFHKLGGKQASKMRGRSEVTYQTCDRGLLKGSENKANDDELK